MIDTTTPTPPETVWTTDRLRVRSGRPILRISGAMWGGILANKTPTAVVNRRGSYAPVEWCYATEAEAAQAAAELAHSERALVQREHEERMRRLAESLAATGHASA